jgi:tetratricopeptide (TPR) repeat protein
VSIGVALSTPRISAAAAPPDAGVSAEREAEHVAEQGYALHAAGRYPEAIAAYLEAYDLAQAATALFNVATIYDRKLHDAAHASEFYRRYVQAPDAEPDLVTRAEGRLAALERAPDASDGAPAEAALVPAPSSTPAAPSSAAPAPPSPLAGSFPSDGGDVARAVPSAPAAGPDGGESRAGSSWKTVGLVVGGAGVASVGASLVLGALALVKNHQANTLCSGTACSSEEGVQAAAQSGHLATASTVTFFAGLALAGAGLTLILTAPRAQQAQQAAGGGLALRLSPAAGPGFAAVNLRGGF